MKNLLKSVFATVLITLVTGCAVHMGYINNSAALGEANFEYVKQGLQGHSEAMYVFAIGGLERKAMVEEAKKDMLKDNPLKANQALVNQTVNWKNSFLLILMRTECYVTADIVEFK